MTVPHVPVPLIVPVPLQLTASDRKDRIGRAAARLKLIRWLTMPCNVFPDVPAWGLALSPANPNVHWRWRLSDGSEFTSFPLVWIGFWGGMWSPDGTLN